jgi:hypothetical protein
MVVLLTFGSFIESAFADEIIDFAVKYPNKTLIKPSSLRGSTHEIAFKGKDKESWDGKLWITGQNYDQLVAIDTNKLLSNDQTSIPHLEVSQGRVIVKESVV